MNFRIASMLAGVGATLTLGSANAAPSETRASFLSSGRKVGIEIFENDSPAQKPAVIVIHGAGGLEYGNGHIRQLATAFAASGLSTYLVHYFDRTGHHYADDTTIRANFETWLDTIGDAVDFVAARPKVDRSRVALFGYSLGGYLAVAQGARNPDVGAVVELAGGIDKSYADKTVKMPPTLVLHGDQDRRVLPERAAELQQLLKKLGTPHEVQIYKGEGHMLSPGAALDALARGMTFLDKYLK